jgi:hypothetical protein
MENKMKTYFSKDSSYGDATDLIVIDTSDWSDDDWRVVDCGSDIYGNALKMLASKGKLNQVFIYDSGDK